MSATTYAEWLEQRAATYWDRGEHVPLDLFYEMLGSGLDVEALESNHTTKMIEEEDYETV